MFFARNSKVLKKEKHSLQKHKKRFWQKAFHGALHKGVKGSMTVETAFILPLFLLGVATLICFMDVMKVQTEKISHLCERAMEEGIHAYLDEEKDLIIDVQETYDYRLPVSIVPLPAMRITNRGRVHSWIGMNRGEGGNEAEDMVYMAVSGSVYHTNPQCSYVDISIHQEKGAEVENKRNSHGAKYTPCGSCAKGQEPAKIVYITAQGRRYHNRLSCSRLKRTVRLIPISDAEGYSQCSRCQKIG